MTLRDLFIDLVDVGLVALAILAVVLAAGEIAVWVISTLLYFLRRNR